MAEKTIELLGLINGCICDVDEIDAINVGITALDIYPVKIRNAG